MALCCPSSYIINLRACPSACGDLPQLCLPLSCLMAHLQTWNTTNTLGKKVMSWISWGSPQHEHGGCHLMWVILHTHNYLLSAKSSVLTLFEIIMSNTYLKHFNYHSSSHWNIQQNSPFGFTGNRTQPDAWMLTYTFCSEKLRKTACEAHFSPPARKWYDYFCWTLSESVRVPWPGWQDCIIFKHDSKSGLETGLVPEDHGFWTAWKENRQKILNTFRKEYDQLKEGIFFKLQ